MPLFSEQLLENTTPHARALALEEWVKAEGIALGVEFEDATAQADADDPRLSFTPLADGVETDVNAFLITRRAVAEALTGIVGTGDGKWDFPVKVEMPVSFERTVVDQALHRFHGNLTEFASDFLTALTFAPEPTLSAQLVILMQGTSSRGEPGHWLAYADNTKTSARRALFLFAAALGGLADFMHPHLYRPQTTQRT